MHDDGSRKAFRVTVRGRFLDLSDEARLYLAGEQPEHDIFKSAYTVEGTFTYDARIDFFNLRYEIPVSGDSPAESASAQGLHEAELFLRTMRFGHRGLKADVVDMSAMWTDAHRRRSISDRMIGSIPQLWL